MEIKTICQDDLDDLLAHDDTVDMNEYKIVNDESECIACLFSPKATRTGWTIEE